MASSATLNPDDEQLQLEMQAMAELLLDIYEYRLQSNPVPRMAEETVLDVAQEDRTIKERSK